MGKNIFTDLQVEMMPEQIKPGEPGNLINKWEGDAWGARISVKHEGPGGEFDFGWFAYFSDKMKTAITSYAFVERHDIATKITVEVSDPFWYAFMFGDGTEIGAEPIIAEGGILEPFKYPWEDKRQPKDIPRCLIWGPVVKVYRVRVGTKWTDLTPGEW